MMAYGWYCQGISAVSVESRCIFYFYLIFIRMLIHRTTVTEF